MLSVKTDLVSIKVALVAGSHRVISDDYNPGRIRTNADPLADPLTRHRVAISRHADQTGAGDPHGAFDIAIKFGPHPFRPAPAARKH